MNNWSGIHGFYRSELPKAVKPFSHANSLMYLLDVSLHQGSFNVSTCRFMFIASVLFLTLPTISLCRQILA